MKTRNQKNERDSVAQRDTNHSGSPKTERLVDKALADSFPASDPPAFKPDVEEREESMGEHSSAKDRGSDFLEKRSAGKEPRRFGRAEPLLKQRGPEVQPYGTLMHVPIGLSEEIRKESVQVLNQVLADTMTLRDMYKKHHWQVAGHTFYQLHLLFDKHYEEQAKIVDLIAERIQSLGGISIAMAHDVAEITRIQRPPRGREEVPVQISRLLEAHELILTEARDAGEKADESGDAGTNDLLVTEVIRTNELQVWFVAEHVVALPVVQAKSA